MTIQLSRYETWELDAMVEQLERPNPWLLRTFFGRSKFFDTKQIEFDIVDRGRRMAPFVAPTVAGKPMVREGYRTRTLTPAYIKPTALV
ncbi:major capsid protein, partial [Escherichia coli]